MFDLYLTVNDSEKEINRLLKLLKSVEKGKKTVTQDQMMAITAMLDHHRKIVFASLVPESSFEYPISKFNQPNTAYNLKENIRL